MDPKTFQSKAAGQLVKVGQSPASYWAFSPNPLSPEIQSDWNLIGALSQADRAVSELAGLGIMLPNPALYIHPFVRREAVLSSRIEGTQSDLTDLYLYEGQQLMYYDLLLAVSQRGAWEEWIIFFLEGVRYQSRDTAARLRRLLNLRGVWNERLRQAHASRSAMQLMDLIFEAPILTIPQAQHYLNMTYHSARRAIDRLIELNILAPMDESAYDRKFIAHEVFEAIVRELPEEP